MAIQTYSRVEPKLTKRQMRYQSDEAYRENAKSLSRRSYRRKANVEISSCLYSLSFLNDAAVIHSVRLPNGSVQQMPVLSIPKTAHMLQKLYQTIWRWVDNGTIPAPVLESLERENRPYKVYHRDEVRVLIEIIGEHEQIVTYLRKDHVEVRKRIEQRILATRKLLGI